MPFFTQVVTATTLFTSEDGLHTTKQEGLPASRSSYSPRLPIPFERNSDIYAAFIPGYGGGSATVSHRLPCYGPFGLLLDTI